MRKTGRNLAMLSALAFSGAAMAGGVASNVVAQMGIPPEVAAVANYTHLGDLSRVSNDQGGETPVRGQIGPDVTVSQIGPTFSYYGTINNISSYAMTTVSCNIGDMHAIWIASQAKHPLIAQNMYRYKEVDGAGRFEMIGMSWLKHGWCAADAPGSGCGSCNSSGPGCDWLGLNCSDTYGASLNATQSDLGPRSEVNAFTATYPYPYIRAWNQSGDAIFKRLQINKSDLDPSMNPGAQYFAEVQYLCTDEAPWGTQYNNSSYRKATVSQSGSNWMLNFTGATIQQRQVLDAWKVIDPEVKIINAQVPDEGRFTLGYRVTDLGNGMWRYEYALQNYNSDRSGGSFSVPIPDGVNVTNIGFHDVFYHSGEPYNGDDWRSTLADGALTWSTESYDVNPNANALRWSTTYNFRFDADAPPASGGVTLGLFKPGTPTSIDIEAAIPSGTVSCAADFDGSGDLTLADFVAFRNAYTAGDMAADFDGDGTLALSDFVAFRNAYTAGCP